MMTEAQALSQSARLNDSARRSARSGAQIIVPHKLKPTGEPISEENFERTDVSRLSLSQLRFLDAFRNSGWDFNKACMMSGVSPEQGKRAYKKCLWFKREDELIRAKAKVPSAEWILAKDLDNVEKTVTLDDSQHKSLDRMAKITGSFKMSEMSITQNVFNLPKLSAEVEAKFKQLAEESLDAEIVRESAA